MQKACCIDRALDKNEKSPTLQQSQALSVMLPEKKVSTVEIYKSHEERHLKICLLQDS